MTTEAAVSIPQAAPSPVVTATPQAPAAEAAPVSPPATPAPEAKEEVDFSAKFAALARKEKQLLERERRYKEELKARESDPELSEFKSWREVKSNPRQHGLKGLELLGLSYKDITDIVLNDGKVPVEKQIEELRGELKAKQEREAEQARLAEQRANEQAINSYRRNIQAHIDSQGETYELIRSQGAYELVLETAEQVFAKTRKVPDIAEVCKHVEAHLEKQVESLLGLKKLSSKYRRAEEQAQSTTQAASTLSATPKTLSNRDVSAAPPVPGDDSALMDPEKRRAWTAAKLRAALHKN